MLAAVTSLAVMGAAFGGVLGVASKKFKVEVDPKVEAILSVAPGANCGSCGQPGCAGFAEA
ncbi:MAG: (Fe-S)-binding protein, partial [Geobacteraceae bacterium]|nr:(Fe-S)-binding protein [Geobacteraceae bacterium]